MIADYLSAGALIDARIAAKAPAIKRVAAQGKPDYITEINAAMATLNASGAYTAQSVSLAGFTAYL